MSSSTAEAELNEDERAGLKLIRESGGIHQSDFWKELEFSSRKGSRIVESCSHQRAKPTHNQKPSDGFYRDPYARAKVYIKGTVS
ncbi:hypothetical protein BDK88_3641 [Natrinema hispanicum]|uniref:Uncharacterized protein n=1 Tax=Natrinema hispanicum TaxID=392421 RepID=A0A482Y330_9EURY|nr:hypothetical protein BDK88_3641 [Natrinema hispanicum]